VIPRSSEWGEFIKILLLKVRSDGLSREKLAEKRKNIYCQSLCVLVEKTKNYFSKEEYYV